MTSYALFLGCTIPARQPQYELSARKALTKLGIELIDLENMTCCAPPPLQSIDLETSLAVAAYNICLAEEADLNMITLCTGCFESLAMANRLLKEKPELKERVNKILANAGKEFKGNKEVRHYLQVLMNDVGINSIKQNIIKPLNNLKVAAFSGCHLLRPSALLRFDDPERPRIFDTLIEALGAKSIWYKNKLRCCGGLLRGYADDVALAIARDKIVNAHNASADCISTLCPFCFLTLDLGQVLIKTTYKEEYNMPIIHYAELLSLSLGVEPKELALDFHKVKIDKVMEKIG
ncbi:MAG: CoB--CoM heterodisulfide reductase iron-sulfur subunit B family protein [Candidatus Bathyarchaeota archaeon]|jgi:heterodisulfide reductase subunit B|nr:CoB--CoM heterodisulfide reductase subunit B [Candidatus Bathyarchaeota archaeon A05DMB-3]MDH7607497.1 CoB--CoM heterodisulfide reductase iron-sulfur subunit B family protein [Candidatus Bathyarchaeota archaeon]